MAIDPTTSALDALVTYLASELTLPAGTYDGVTVSRGWPKHSVKLDLSSGIVVAVTAGDPTTTAHAPVRVDHDTDTGVTTYRVARVETVVQLDIWAPYEATLDAAGAAMALVLHNDLPHRPDLHLTQADYYGRPLRFTLVNGPRRPERAHAAEADWRSTWTLRLYSSLVAQGTNGTLTQLDIQTALDGVSTTTTVTP